jgi:LacI family transcriptional regulator
LDIRQLAKRARVSTATASRAMNHVPTVQAHLAKRVWKAVDELGYYPNTQARALASGKTRTFGLIVSQITNPFFSEVVHSFGEIAVQQNYEIFLSSTSPDPKRMDMVGRRLLERRVDGVAIITFGMEEALIELFRSNQIPVVHVGAGPSAARVSHIRVNYQHGIRQAVQHLAALRHERIAFVMGPPHLASASCRRAAFVECMREIGLDVSNQAIVAGNHMVEGGSQALEQIMMSSHRPSAVICSNDMTAIGLMRAAVERGIRIPEELSVVGFDDIRLAQFTTPPLTTVQMSQAMLAEYAFNALRNEVDRTSTTANRANLPPAHEYELITSLVLRESTSHAGLRTSSKTGFRMSSQTKYKMKRVAKRRI